MARRTASGLTVAVGLLALAEARSSQQQQQQKQSIPAPKWLDDQGKDLFNDLESEEVAFGEAACEMRDKLLMKMAGKGDADAGQQRARVLLGQGVCELKKENWAMAKRRLESAISEMNVPSEDAMMQNIQVAHIPLLKQAATFMGKGETSQAATALRRCREVMNRHLKQVLKYVHKQITQQGNAPPLEAFTDELPGFGKTGEVLPGLIPQVPILKQELATAELVEQTLDGLDRRLAAVDASLKQKKARLDVSKGKASKGTLMYAKALVTDAVARTEHAAVAKELQAAVGGALKDFVGTEKSVTLWKKLKQGAGCKDGADKLCKGLSTVPDVASNPFGEARLLTLKDGKHQRLESCTTNSHIGILLTSKDGVSVTVSGHAGGAVKLNTGEPVVVDFCRDVSIQAPAGGSTVLFVQAWHPEFAALERTTEIRGRSKALGLAEEDVKAATKIVNDNAKKTWENTAAAWRAGSESLAAAKQALDEEAQDKLKAAEEASASASAGNSDDEEERKLNLEKLEQKREAKRLKEKAAEEKRIARKKQLEEERANRDPWLNFPEVLDAEKNLEELKEARRDANAKLEFDLSTQLTKDISASERALQKTIKKARKAHKKGETPGVSATKEDDGSADAKKQVKALKKELSEVGKKKQEAASTDNFKEAKKLKLRQLELEEEIKKLEL